MHEKSILDPIKLACRECLEDGLIGIEWSCGHQNCCARFSLPVAPLNCPMPYCQGKLTESSLSKLQPQAKRLQPLDLPGHRTHLLGKRGAHPEFDKAEREFQAWTQTVYGHCDKPGHLPWNQIILENESPLPLRLHCKTCLQEKRVPKFVGRSELVLPFSATPCVYRVFEFRNKYLALDAALARSGRELTFRNDLDSLIAQTFMDMNRLVPLRALGNELIRATMFPSECTVQMKMLILEVLGRWIFRVAESSSAHAMAWALNGLRSTTLGLWDDEELPESLENLLTVSEGLETSEATQKIRQVMSGTWFFQMDPPAPKDRVWEELSVRIRRFHGNYFQPVTKERRRKAACMAFLAFQRNLTTWRQTQETSMVLKKRDLPFLSAQFRFLRGVPSILHLTQEAHSEIQFRKAVRGVRDNMVLVKSGSNRFGYYLSAPWNSNAWTKTDQAFAVSFNKKKIFPRQGGRVVFFGSPRSSVWEINRFGPTIASFLTRLRQRTGTHRLLKWPHQSSTFCGKNSSFTVG